jgi:hypothetical protein
MTVEFTIEGLSPKQMVLADIIWGLDGMDEVLAFMSTLPKRERKECVTIVELMKMAVVEQCYDGINPDMPEAQSVLNQFKL